MPRGRWDAVVALALAAVAGLCLAVRYLPQVDLPQHYAMVSIMVHHGDAAYGFGERYHFDFVGRPYATVYVLAAALARVLPLGVAMHLVVALCTVAPLAGVALLLRALRRPVVWTLLVTPFAFGSVWHWGFLNFLLGTGLFLAGVALVVEQARAPTRRRAVLLGLGSLLVLFTHFHGLVMLLITAPGFAWALAPRTAGAPLRARLAAVARPLWPLAPGAVAAAAFVLVTWSQAQGSWARMDPGLALRWRELPSFLGAGIADPWPVATLGGFAALAVVALALGLARRGGDGPAFAGRRELVAAGVALAIQVAGYFFLPLNTSTATYVSARHALLCVLLVLPLLPELRGVAGGALKGAAVVFAVTTLLVAGRHLVRFDAEARSFEPVLAAMPPDRLVLPMIFDRSGREVNPRTFPYLHFAAYYQAAKGGDLSHSFATVWNVPIRYRDDYRRHVIDEELEWDPGLIRADDIARFDYVLARSPAPPYFTPRLGLRLVAESGPWRLYENPAARAR